MTGRARQDLGTGIGRVGVTIVLAFALIAGGAGYWQVIDSQTLSTARDNPLVIAVHRNVLRGLIRDRDGHILAKNAKDSNGEPFRVYADPAVSDVLGYASLEFATAGLERSYDGQLTGLTSADPVRDVFRKFESNPYDPQDLTLSLSLSLQQAAVKALGSDKGAVVMLDPKTGEVLALASTPTFDASDVANPATGEAAFAKLQKDEDRPLLNRATQGLYVPGSVFKIVTSVAALGSGAITPDTKYPQQPATEKTGLLVSGFRIRDGHHPFTDGTVLDYASAVEVSCNIYFALTGLRVGGDQLADWAGRLGFGQPIPFDLATSASQVTNGGGNFGGGFKDKVELANAAYGQAETLVTPLQMALVAATIANGGVLMKPYLVTALSGRSGTSQIPPSEWRRVLPPDESETIKGAMERAVEGQFGRIFTSGAAIPGIPTAGKSGTAQLGGTGEPHSWFIGFAPVDDPKIAIAVIVEHGGHGSVRASPIAGQLMKLYLDTVGA